MPDDKSHLSTLASLVQSAEARRSAMPPPLPGSAAKPDSGLIDFLAMQREAKEQKEDAAKRVTPTPAPTVAPVMHDATMSQSTTALAGAFTREQRRRKRVLLGGVLAGALVAVVSVVGGVVHSHNKALAAAQARAAQAAVVVTPPPAPAPPPPPVVEPPPPAPAPVVAAATAVPETAKPAKKGKGKHRKSHATKGRKLEKVTSGGT